MPTTKKLTVTFDGVNDAPRLSGQTSVPWYGKSLTTYDVWYSGPKDKFVFSGNLTGTDWKLKYLRVASDDSKMILKDLDNGAGREIRYLELGWNSDVDLISTRARYVFGWDGDKHDVELGSGTTYAVNLFALENFVTTGTGWVASILTGGKDTIVVSDAGAGSIQTGHGDAHVSTGAGGVEAIKTGDGNDIVNIGSGGAVHVRTKAGNDNVKTTSGDVDLIITNEGDDKVIVGSGGGNFVRTDSGNDTVITGKGAVDFISTGDGNDVVKLGVGANGGTVRLGSDNDVVTISEMTSNGGVQVHGGSGTDTIDFSKFATGVTFTLDGVGIYQNLINPGGLAGMGWISETGFENISGTNKGDTLTGDGAANKLVGRGGVDRLYGGIGDDDLKGDGGNDKLYGEAGKDTLFGGNGNDVLVGGKGNDTLRGNAGADIFVFGKKSGTDKVIDFADGVDTLRISDHSGGFSKIKLLLSTTNNDVFVDHDGGRIVIKDGFGNVTLTAADFDFV